MRWRIFLVAMVAACVAAFPAIAIADDAAMGGGGGAVKPIPSSSIRMEAETVQIIAYDRFAQYQVDFKFVNAGAPQRIKLGFPFRLPYDAGSDYQPPAAFSAWSGETPLAVTYEEVTAPGQGRTGYYLHTADFPTGTTMIRVRYYAIPDTSVGQPGDDTNIPPRFAGSATYHGAYPYIMHSGAGWAGTIGTSVIRYYVSPDALAWGFDAAIADRAQWFSNAGSSTTAKVLQSYTRPADGIFQWTFKDIEPTPDANGVSAYDVGLQFYVPGQNSDAVPAFFPIAQTTASSELNLGGTFQYTAYNATDGDPSTAWAEAAKGSGQGQSLTVTFPKQRHIATVRVLPGYAKTRALFRKYNRPKVLDVAFSDGTNISLSLADEPVMQTFHVNTDATSAKVTIADVYRGTTRDETYLSEIGFDSAPAPVMLAFADVLAGRTSLPGIAATSSVPGTVSNYATGPGAGPLSPPTQTPTASGPATWLLAAAGFVVGIIALIGIVVIVVQIVRRAREPRPAPQEPATTDAPPEPQTPQEPPAA